MVNAHPLLAITPEAQWIHKYFEEQLGLTPEGLARPELICHLLEEPKFTRWQVGREKLEALLGTNQPVSYPEFVTGLFGLYGQRKGKALVGNKTPRYVRILPTLHALWPAARFVHLTRDGRDVCLSMASWPRAHQHRPGVFATWKHDSVSTTALWWDLNVRLGRQAGDSLGPQLYYELRYESLVANPQAECAALCAFLGLPYDDAMLRFHEGKTKMDPDLDAKHAWVPITPGLRDWKSQMPGEDVERFEAAAGDLLDELGYERATPRPQPHSLEKAVRIRAMLANDSNWVRATASR